MKKKQYFILIIAFIAGLVLSRCVDAQEITGPSVTSIGRQAVFDIDGVTSADWCISTGCDMFVDSNTLRVIVTPFTRGTQTLHAAVVIDGNPKLVRWQFEVTGTDYDRDNDQDKTPRPDPIPVPVTLAEWVRQNRPASLSDAQTATLAVAFSSTVNNIDSGAIRTVESAYNSIRTTTTPFFINNAEVKKFLEGISERTKGQELKELAESYKIVSDELQVKMTKLQEAFVLPVMEPPVASVKSSKMVRACNPMTGRCIMVLEDQVPKGYTVSK